MISTGNKELDALIDGYSGEISCIYGPGGSGKTTLAKMAAIKLAKEGKKTLFLDTENGFSTDRIKQMVGSNYITLLDKIILMKVHSFENQCKKINDLLNIYNKFSLIIIDTIGNYYRREVSINPKEANNSMDKQFKVLSEIARNGVPVLITNQVYTDFKKQEIGVVGGEMIRNWSKRLIELSKSPRRLFLKKPEVKEVSFKIEDRGLIVV